MTLRTGWKDPYQAMCRLLFSKATLLCVVVSLFYALLRFQRIGEALRRSGSYQVPLTVGPLLQKYAWGLHWSFDAILYPLQQIEDAISPGSHLFGLLAALTTVSCLGLATWSFGVSSGNQRRAHLKMLAFGVGWFIVGFMPSLLARALAAYHFLLPNIGIVMLSGYMFGELCKHVERKRRWYGRGALVLSVVLLLGIAIVRVNDLDRTSWPSPHSRLNKATLALVQDRHTTLPRDSRIYLVGFPPGTWRTDTASWAFRLFYDRDDVEAFLAPDIDSLGPFDDCSNVLVFAYVDDGETPVREVPCSSVPQCTIGNKN